MYNILFYLEIPMMFLAPIVIGFMATWFLQTLFIWIEKIRNIYLHWFFNLFIIVVIGVIFNGLIYDSLGFLF